MVRRSTFALRDVLVPAAVIAFLSVLLCLAVNRVRASVAEAQARHSMAHGVSVQQFSKANPATHERRLP